MRIPHHIKTVLMMLLLDGMYRTNMVFEQSKKV